MNDVDLTKFPKNVEELKLMMKDDRLIQELEQYGIELRYDEKTDNVTIKKHDTQIET